MLKERDVVSAIDALKAVDKSTSNGDLIKEIEKHCSVTNQTAKKWLRGEVPRGLLQVKLIQYLVYQGVLTKSRTLHDTLDYLAQLVAFSVISADDACEYVGIGGSNPSNRLYPIFREEESVPASILSGEISLSELRDSYDIDLSAAKERVLRFADLVFKQPKTDAHSAVKKVLEADITTDKQPSHQAIQHHPDLLSLAAQVSSVMPGLRFLSVYCSPEQRSEFRKLMGENGMFELSNLANGLCSERSKRGIQ